MLAGDAAYPRTHQQCCSGNSTVPLGRYCSTYQSTQRRWSSGRGLTSMRGRCAPAGAYERAPAGAGVCATASDIVAASDTAARLVLTVNDFTDMAFCFAFGLLPAPRSRIVRRRSTAPPAGERRAERRGLR